MKSIDIAAQLRNLGFKGKAESLRTGQVLINRGKTVSAKISNNILDNIKTRMVLLRKGKTYVAM